MGNDAQGAEERIRDLVEARLSQILGSLLLIAESREEAEAALAEALGRAWDALTRRKPIRSLEGWVFVVAFNELRRTARRRSRRSSAKWIEEPSGQDQEDPTDLRDAVRQLPRRQRTAVVLYYWYDLSVADVAHTMHIAEGTVKALLHQSRARLRASLEPSKEAQP